MTTAESALKAVNDALVLLRQDKGVTQSEFDGTEESVLGRKCSSVYESCRMEVLLAKNWNFNRKRIAVESVYKSERDIWKTGLPIGTLKVCSAFRMDGEKAKEWDVVGDEILFREAVFGLEIIEDEQNVGEWPTLVRRAFVYALARDLAIPVTGRRNDLEVMNALYADKLNKAALHDARETQPGEEAWGRNTYADRIKGTFLRKREVRVI